jgi:hypothetical protein
MVSSAVTAVVVDAAEVRGKDESFPVGKEDDDDDDDDDEIDNDDGVVNNGKTISGDILS